MEQVFGFMILLVSSLCVYSKPPYTNALPQNISLTSESLDSHDFSVNDFSWAKGNLSCANLQKDCIDYLSLLPPSSLHLIKPALVLGLMNVGCLLEKQLYTDLLADKDTREIYELLTEQMKTSVHQPSIHLHKTQKHVRELEILTFNLHSLLPTALPELHQNCSGFHKKQNFFLNGLNMGAHKSVKEAKMYCKYLGSSCAGVSSHSGRYYTVARNGGYIMPQRGIKMWLHHCNAAYRIKRSSAPECISEKELCIHRVMEWIPVVNGWYNAGSAIYYATQGCSKIAEDRAVEAASDLGYDAVVAATGGATSVVSVGVGVAVKPAIKAGVKKAIDYFKSESQ
ncbi:apolipoprotein F [Pyxicephalus adspersus]|uniref:apolipoprotein F n=1 Tax=Pyxicephalus adspersus TaxID=30357 RepID=UPI003B5CD3C5